MQAQELENRKGATRLSDIPPAVKLHLDQGQLPTANLTEWLAVDHQVLLENVLTGLQRAAYIQPCFMAISTLKQKSTPQIIQRIGQTLLEKSQADKDAELFGHLSAHPSDSVRCWATYFIGLDGMLTLDEKLNAIRFFASDNHFGVREIAWMAIRPSLEKDLPAAIRILATWTADSNGNVRRFASEATRPRGVWCKHLEALKQQPALGIPILDPLKSDPEKYVQDSVANWLNDASKSQPSWVVQICQEWLLASPTKETKKITEKALRTVRKGVSE